MMSMTHAISFCSCFLSANDRMCLVGISQHLPCLRFTVRGMIEEKVSSVHREEPVSLGYGNEAGDPDLSAELLVPWPDCDHCLYPSSSLK